MCCFKPCMSYNLSFSTKLRILLFFSTFATPIWTVFYPQILSFTLDLIFLFSDNHRQNIWEFFKMWSIFPFESSKFSRSPKINVANLLISSSIIKVMFDSRFSNSLAIKNIIQHWFWGEEPKKSPFFQIPNIFWRWLSEIRKVHQLQGGLFLVKRTTKWRSSIPAIVLSLRIYFREFPNTTHLWRVCMTSW